MHCYGVDQISDSMSPVLPQNMLPILSTTHFLGKFRRIVDT